MAYRKDITKTQFSNKMTKLWDDLVARNPELDKIKYNPQKIKRDPQDSKACYYMIQGVASAFNVDDIQFFIAKLEKGEPPALKMTKGVAYKSLSQEFNKAADQMQWAASPKTLRSIEAQLQKKYQQKKLSGKTPSNKKVVGRKFGP